VHGRIGDESKDFFNQMERFQEEHVLTGVKYICFLNSINGEIIEYVRARTAFGGDASEIMSMIICKRMGIYSS
jgi:hypothetical protein